MKLSEVLSPGLYSQVEAEINAHNSSISDKAKQVRFIDLSEGGYVSKDKYQDKVDSLTTQSTTLQEQLNKREADLQDLTTQLQSAKTDADKLAEVQNSLAAKTAAYEKEKQELVKQMQEQAYDFALKERAGKLKFSSKSAEKAFLAEAKSKAFKVDGENLVGYNEWLSAYQEGDPGAFIKEEPANLNVGKSPVGTGANSGSGLQPNGFNFNFSGVRPHK